MTKVFGLSNWKGGEDHQEVWFEEVKFEIPSGYVTLSLL